MLIDIHIHIGRVAFDRSQFVDVTNLIAKMDKWGIDKAIILPLSEHPEGAYLHCNTEDILHACTWQPRRLIPFCLIDPRFGNHPDKDFRPLLEEYIARGCKGLGEFLPNMDFDHPLCLNLYRQCGELGLPVLFDMTDGPYGYGVNDSYGLPRLENALRLCPGTTFIGHGPTFWAEISADVPAEERNAYPAGPVQTGGAVPRLMRQFDNLWADTSATSGYNALTRDHNFGLEFMDEFQDKLIFGTDSCLRTDVERILPIVEFRQRIIAEKWLSPECVEKISHLNCERLLGLDPTPAHIP